MQIEKTQQHEIKISIDTKTANIPVNDLIASIIATIGPEDWLTVLTQSHMKVAHSLHNQNFGDVGTEAYDPNNPQRGLDLEDLTGKIASVLMDLRDEIADSPVK